MEEIINVYTGRAGKGEPQQGPGQLPRSLDRLCPALRRRGRRPVRQNRHGQGRQGALQDGQRPGRRVDRVGGAGAAPRGLQPRARGSSPRRRRAPSGRRSTSSTSRQRRSSACTSRGSCGATPASTWWRVSGGRTRPGSCTSALSSSRSQRRRRGRTFLNFLEAHQYYEESFKVFERGPELFHYPVAFELWNLYLTKAWWSAS